VGGGGVGEAGGDRVDPDAVGAELAGEDLGERDRRGIFGSDIPHGDRLANAAKVLHERTDLKDDVKRKMLLDNVARFYKMPVE
jgi:predicted TIM-barrel fold metal-dependent hydrolase